MCKDCAYTHTDDAETNSELDSILSDRIGPTYTSECVDQADSIPSSKCSYMFTACQENVVTVKYSGVPGVGDLRQDIVLRSCNASDHPINTCIDLDESDSDELFDDMITSLINGDIEEVSGKACTCDTPHCNTRSVADILGEQWSAGQSVRASLGVLLTMVSLVIHINFY